MSAVATAIVGSAIIGGVVAKNASDNAASAAGNIANAQRDQQMADRALALKYAEASPEELAQLQRGIALNESDIARKTKLLESADPAIIEAGQQALKLLRGEEAKTLGPVKSQIAKQEQALRSKLQAQLGPGYENTTAGIQALQAFNEQANNAISTAQQGSLAQLLGVAQDVSQGGLQNNIANTGSLASLFGQNNARKVSAINGTPISSAGLGMSGEMISARNQAQLGQTIATTGGTLAGLLGSGGSYGGGTTSTTASPTANSANYGATLNGGGSYVTVPGYT